MTEEYFYREQGKAKGPVSVTDISERLRSNRLKLTDWIFRGGDNEWRMVVQYSELRTQVDQSKLEVLKQKPWVLLKRKPGPEVEFITSGPFTELELKDGIKHGRVSYSDYLWRDGLEEWKRIGFLNEFSNYEIPAETTQAKPKVEIPARELIRNVVELKRAVPPQEMPPPLEAVPLSSSPSQAITSKPIKHSSSISSSMSNSRPIQVPFPIDDDTKPHRTSDITRDVTRDVTREVAREVTRDVTKDITTGMKRKKRSRLRTKFRIFDWALVGFLALVLAGSVIYGSRFFTKPIETPEFETTTTEAEIPKVEVKNQAGVTIREEPPEPVSVDEPAARPKLAPTELELNITNLTSTQIKIELKTDASPEYPVYVQIVGQPGHVSDGASFYRFLRFTPSTDSKKPIDLSGVKLPYGRFVFRASTGKLKKETRVSIGVDEAQFKQTVKRLRKLHAHSIWKERIHLFKLAQRLETAVIDQLAGKKFNPAAFKGLNEVKRSNGERFVLFDIWFELKEIAALAKEGPDKAVLERARQVRERLASFSVWK